MTWRPSVSNAYFAAKPDNPVLITSLEKTKYAKNFQRMIVFLDFLCYYYKHMPKWRNWQTHLTQNQAKSPFVPVRVRPSAPMLSTLSEIREAFSFPHCVPGVCLCLKCAPEHQMHLPKPHCTFSLYICTFCWFQNHIIPNLLSQAANRLQGGEFDYAHNHDVLDILPSPI